MSLVNSEFVLHKRPQKTLARPSLFSGIGLHTGKQVEMRFLPAAEGQGVVFRRVDLDGAPEIPAHLDYVCDTNRSTTIGSHGVFVHTVEHVLAAVYAYQIDNLVIEVTDKEPPIANGSSDVFVQMIEESGIQEQNASVSIVGVQKPHFFSSGDAHVAFLPYHEFRVSYSLHYPDAKALQNQFFSTLITPENFKKELAPCRTFSRYEEVEYLLDRGLIKGGSLANTLIVQGEATFSKEGLFFPNEMARHKALDAVGDFALIGFPLQGHLVGYRSGHKANVEFAKELLAELCLKGEKV